MVNCHQFIFLAFCILCLCSYHVYYVLGQEACTTPNGDGGKCIRIHNCTVIIAAIMTRNQTAFDFAKKSQCGFEQTPLVCCGQYGQFTKIPTNQVAPEPSGEALEEIVPIEPFAGVDSATASSNPLPTSTTVKPLSPRPPNNSHKYPTNATPQQETSNTILADRGVCGRQMSDDRLYGGTQTNIEEFPWMVLMRYTYNHDKSDAGYKCAGTLINRRYVLTAAHCLKGVFTDSFRFSSVRLGEHDLSKESDCIMDQDYEECADPVVDVGVEELVPHPFYNTQSGNNDIALLRLDNDLNFTQYIRPICLPPITAPTPPPGVRMTVAGWGATENGSQSAVKLKIEVPIVGNGDCATKLSFNRQRITANHVCAGGVAGVDACKGDSGGPLMHIFSDSDDGPQWYQEGIVSRGIGCGSNGYPGIYTRVSRYLNWILTNLRP